MIINNSNFAHPTDQDPNVRLNRRITELERTVDRILRNSRATPYPPVEGRRIYSNTPWYVPNGGPSYSALAAGGPHNLTDGIGSPSGISYVNTSNRTTYWRATNFLLCQSMAAVWGTMYLNTVVWKSGSPTIVGNGRVMTHNASGDWQSVQAVPNVFAVASGVTVDVFATVNPVGATHQIVRDPQYAAFYLEEMGPPTGTSHYWF